MATINFSNLDDVIVPTNNGFTYRGLGGPDIYVLSDAIKANAKISIVDTTGSNRIQLINGLSIASSKFAADAVQLTLSNGAVVTINGASNFSYELSSNITTGEIADSSTFSKFASLMGVETLPTKGATSGSSNITVGKNGLTSSNSPTFSLTKDTNEVVEGSEVTFTITASSPVSSDTSFSWNAAGDTNDSTVNAAVNADIETLSGTALISSGSSSVTFKVKITNDSEDEPLEGVKVNVFDKDSSLIGSSIFLINNDAGDSSSISDLLGTDGDDDLTLTSGDDSYEYTSGNDKIDGGAGSDTFIASSEDVSIVRAIDVRGEDAYTGIEGKDFLYIISKNQSGYTVATNFENIEYDGVKSSLDNFPSYVYVDVSSWRNDTEGVKIQDQNIENNDSKTINLDNNFFTINKDASLSYSVDFSNDKVSDQISISGSNLNIQGGVGGDKYEVKVTVRATQSFSDGRTLSDDFMYEEDTFIITLSDDDYIPVNASNSLVPSSSNLTKISVTEDIKGGVLLDLTSLNIDKGSIKIKSWGQGSNYKTDLFSDFFYLDEEVLKLKDDVIFNTDRSEIIRLDSLNYFSNATSGEFDIVFDYESNGTNKRHIVKITEFIDTIYGQGIYGDGNFSNFSLDDEYELPSTDRLKSLDAGSYFINTNSNNSEITEIFYSFVPKDSKDIYEATNLDKYYQSTDKRDTIYDPTPEFKSAIYEILEMTSSIFNIEFTELTGSDVDKANIRFVLWDSPVTNVSGYSSNPGYRASFIFIANDQSFNIDADGYGTIIHELGHALGIDHPFDNFYFDNISSDYNSSLFSVMAYSDVYNTVETNPYTDDEGYAKSSRVTNEIIAYSKWGMLDISVLGLKYGFRTEYNNADNVYTFEGNDTVTLIHDMGGYDTLDISSWSNDNDSWPSLIDLNGGAVFQVNTFQLRWGGDLTSTGQVITTSLETKIEKFLGSSGNDKVLLGETSDTIFTYSGDDIIWLVGLYKLAETIKVDAGSGDDEVLVYIDNDMVSSLLDIDGGSGYDWLRIWNEEDEIDLTIYIEHFDNFETYWFNSNSAQTITIDELDFIELSSGLLGIYGDVEDTVILPEGAVEDTSIVDENYDYYVLNDVTIAIHDDLMIG